MKLRKAYILITAALVLSLTACQKEEPDLFDPSNNGVYFDYEDENAFKADINFATSIVRPIDSINIDIKVKLLGYLADRERVVRLVGDSVAGQGMARIDSLPKTITFAPNEFEKVVSIMVRRPAFEDSTFATVLRLEPVSSDLGDGLEGKKTFTVLSSCTYSAPADWKDYDAYDLYGEWTKEKHIFLAAEVYQKDFYYQQTIFELGMGYDPVLAFLRDHRDSVNFDVPYYYTEDLSAFKFSRPDYWDTTLDTLVANFSSTTASEYTAGLTFIQIAQAAGLTTKTDSAWFAGGEERAKEINEFAVSLMQDVYDQFYLNTRSTMSYAYYYNVPLSPYVVYELRQPLCWSKNAPEGNALLLPYYGEYTPEKFSFMLKTLLASNSPHKSLINLFPISRQWNDETEVYDAIYDNVYKDNSYTSMYEGKDILKELNTLFRQADTENKFNFPTLAE